MSRSICKPFGWSPYFVTCRMLKKIWHGCVILSCLRYWLITTTIMYSSRFVFRKVLEKKERQYPHLVFLPSCSFWVLSCLPPGLLHYGVALPSLIHIRAIHSELMPHEVSIYEDLCRNKGLNKNCSCTHFHNKQITRFESEYLPSLHGIDF